VLGIPQVGNKGHLNGQLSEKENAQLFLTTVTNRLGYLRYEIFFYASSLYPSIISSISSMCQTEIN
jgi:hypothetical protein